MTDTSYVPPPSLRLSQTAEKSMRPAVMTRNAASATLIAWGQKATADAVVSGGGGAATLAHVSLGKGRGGWCGLPSLMPTQPRRPARPHVN